MDIYSKEMPAAVDFCDNTLQNYNKWVFGLFKNHIGKNILEVGAGTGRFSLMLAQTKPAKLVLLEPSPLFAGKLREISKGYFEVIQSNIDSFNKPDLYNKFDTIVMIQVLEHIDDDVYALNHLSKYLAKGGKIIIQVPAMDWLYGHWDKQIGHFRRYSKKSIKALASKINLNINHIFYFNSLSVFGWWYNFCLKHNDFRNLSDKKQLNQQGIFFDKYLVPVISTIEKFIQPPIGLGLNIILEKQ